MSRQLIDNLGVKWSEVRYVETRMGLRALRTAEPGDEFWDAWRAHKADLKEAGIGVSKSPTGEWQVCHWGKPSTATKTERSEAIEASRAADADIVIPSPDGLDYLSFQKAGIAYVLERQHTLIADEMGLGKGIQAIGVINAVESIENVLVVCPASLKINWQRELEKWLVRPAKVGVCTAKEWPLANIVVINYAILGKKSGEIARGIRWDLLIVDECHKCKNPKTARTKHVLQIKADRKLFLTGTPILNKPIEIQPIVGSIMPEFSKFWTFAKRYCNAHKNRWGWDFSGSSNLQELQQKLRERVMVRRLKSEVLTELPPKRRQVIEVSANGYSGLIKRERAAWDEYESTLEDLQAKVELAKAGTDAEYKAAIKDLRSGVQVAFQAVSQVRHDLAVAKVPSVVEHVRDVLDSEDCVLVFAHHHDVVDALRKEFGADAVWLTGRDNATHRQEAVDRFQNDKNVRVFIGSIQAAGVGLTLTRASHVIFAELDWVPGNMTQAEDRAHRIGQFDQVLIQHLVVEGSLDVNMARKLVRKQEIIDRALDRAEPVIDDEPEPPTKLRPATKDTSRSKLAGLALSLRKDQVAAAHDAVTLLAVRCDGARAIDGQGFNKIDSAIGKSLAAQRTLSVNQGALAWKLCQKYKRQLPDSLLERLAY